jgi:hypothetical protein
MPLGKICNTSLILLQRMSFQGFTDTTRYSAMVIQRVFLDGKGLFEIRTLLKADSETPSLQFPLVLPGRQFAAMEERYASPASTATK